MLVLYESPAGYMLFKVLKEKTLKEAKLAQLSAVVSSKPEKLLELKAFHKFQDTTEALAAATALVDGKLDKPLRKWLKKNLKNLQDTLAIADSKLGNAIKAKLGIECVNNSSTLELMRGIRSSLVDLVPALHDANRNAMALGLSHSLSRYKLKFSPDKVDTMIVQAINLLDELDKEINTYAMRAREWYGWHFPEMGKIVTDNIDYAKCVLKAGIRKNFKEIDFSDVLSEDIEIALKETCEMSMGTEISEDDIKNVKSLCLQVIELSAYRTKLFNYLKNRMAAIAPNLTVMVGELVGARLIAHAGSLLNLAKAPASTVQILGAEKALFRALKTKHDTPKYGLIYHASLIGQSAQKNKGKVSRILAAKTALAIRVDALGDQEGATIGYECREKVEARMRQLETGQPFSLQPTSQSKQLKKYDRNEVINGTSATYNKNADVTLNSESKKRKQDMLNNETYPENIDDNVATLSHTSSKKKKGKPLVEDITESKKKKRKREKKDSHKAHRTGKVDEKEIMLTGKGDETNASSKDAISRKSKKAKKNVTSSSLKKKAKAKVKSSQMDETTSDTTVATSIVSRKKAKVKAKSEMKTQVKKS